MLDISVVGHKVPDTDCTLSAIIACDYLNKKGYNATAYIQ
jgi:inorganic pyrophosphatase/exopolyphosphatase